MKITKALIITSFMFGCFEKDKALNDIAVKHTNIIQEIELINKLYINNFQKFYKQSEDEEIKKVIFSSVQNIDKHVDKALKSYNKARASFLGKEKVISYNKAALIYIDKAHEEASELAKYINTQTNLSNHCII